MIGKVSRGDRVAGLLHYLYGPGRANEHTDQHLAAAWDSPTRLEPGLLPDGRYDLRRLADLLGQPLAASTAISSGTGALADKPVWHCSLRTAPEDPVLDDAEWDSVTREVLHRTGLAPRDDPGGCRWVAVRHAEDHVHLVVTLARQDGARVRLFRDYYQVGEACRAEEERLGLQRTAARDRTAAPSPTRAETEKAAREGALVPARVQLRQRAHLAAAVADSPQAFLSELRSRGVLVRERLSEQHPGQVTGYAVALPGDLAADGSPVWFGGSKLAPELSWARLQHRWLDHDEQEQGRPGPERSMSSAPAPGQRLIAAGPTSSQTSAPTTVDTITAATTRLSEATATLATTSAPGADRATAEGIGMAGCDVLSVTADLLEGPGSGPLREAADLARRAARPSHGRPTPSSPIAIGLRRAARDLARLPRSEAGGDQARRATVQLLRATAHLIDAIIQLRVTQDRIGQVRSATRSARLVRDAADVRAPHARQPAGAQRSARRARPDHTVATPVLQPGRTTATPPRMAPPQPRPPRR